MSASITDKVTDTRNGARPHSARVSTLRSPGATTLACDNLAGWPVASKVHFVTYQIDSSSDPVAGTQLDCYGIVTGNNIGSLVVVDGTDIGNSVNDVVEMLPTAAWGQDLSDALMSQHTRTGAHGVVTATSVAASTGAFTSLTVGGLAVGGGVNGWTDPNETWTYASATTITVPSDATTKYAVGDRIQLTQTTVKYFNVVGVAATTLTITGGTDYTLVNAAISANYFSHQTSPVGFPQWFAYTPANISWNGTPPSGSTVTTAKFSVIGRTCEINIIQTNTVAGTSNSSVQFGLPITPVGTASKYNYIATAGLSDNTQDVYMDIVTAAMLYDTTTPLIIIKYLASTVGAKTVWANARYQI